LAGDDVIKPASIENTRDVAALLSTTSKTNLARSHFAEIAVLECASQRSKTTFLKAGEAALDYSLVPNGNVSGAIQHDSSLRVHLNIKHFFGSIVVQDLIRIRDITIISLDRLSEGVNAEPTARMDVVL